MAAKPKIPEEPKRLNRVVGAGEALQKALDPVFRKRGFAGRDIITYWASMAPSPYHQVAAPDRLVWPRGERSAEGATLYLRCAPGHALAIQHEGPAIAAAVNRYFGYVLVGSVRLSAEPFSPSSSEPVERPAHDEARTNTRLDQVVEAVSDDGVRNALRRLGKGIMGKSRR